MAASCRFLLQKMLRGECFKQRNITGPLFPQMLVYLGPYPPAFCKRVVREAELPDPFLPKCYGMTCQGNSNFCCHHQKDQDTSCIICFLTETSLLPARSKIFLSLTTHHPHTQTYPYSMSSTVSIFLGDGKQSNDPIFIKRRIFQGFILFTYKYLLNTY